jgi:hypothetical protein
MSVSNATENKKTKDLSARLERLQAISCLSESDWCDVLEIHWKDYQELKMGRMEVAGRTLENLSEFFGLGATEILEDSIDFSKLALKFEKKGRHLPDRYLNAAFGRRRSSINSMQFLEDKISWKLRSDVIQKFEIPESEMQDPFGKISVLFMTDLCDYLHRRGFQAKDFHSMGAYNYVTSSNSLIGKYYSELRSLTEVYESFFLESMKFFEANCTYKLIKLDSSGGVFEVWSNPDVAAELGVRHIGNEHLCSFKGGHAASMTQFLGQPMAQIRETACVHNGSSCCRYEFNFVKRPS